VEYIKSFPGSANDITTFGEKQVEDVLNRALPYTQVQAILEMKEGLKLEDELIPNEIESAEEDIKTIGEVIKKVDKNEGKVLLTEEQFNEVIKEVGLDPEEMKYSDFRDRVSTIQLSLLEAGKGTPTEEFIGLAQELPEEGGLVLNFKGIEVIKRITSTASDYRSDAARRILDKFLVLPEGIHVPRENFDPVIWESIKSIPKDDLLARFKALQNLGIDPISYPDLLILGSSEIAAYQELLRSQDIEELTPELLYWLVIALEEYHNAVPQAQGMLDRLSNWFAELRDEYEGLNQILRFCLYAEIAKQLLAQASITVPSCVQLVEPFRGGQNQGLKYLLEEITDQLQRILAKTEEMMNATGDLQRKLEASKGELQQQVATVEKGVNTRLNQHEDRLWQLDMGLRELKDRITELEGGQRALERSIGELRGSINQLETVVKADHQRGLWLLVISGAVILLVLITLIWIISHSRRARIAG